MANSKHVEVLRRGTDAWNEWRRKNSEIQPNLTGVNLKGEDDFWRIDFSRTKLNGADLRGTQLSFADLRGAHLKRVKLLGGLLSEANLADADLSNADLSGARIYNTNFARSILAGTDFTDTVMGGTIFSATDLSEVKGLDVIRIRGPVSIGVDTLYLSKGNIPDEFLLASGLPEEVLEHLLPAIRMGSPIQWNSCFISYSTKDEKFAQRLHSRMRQAGLRVWFAAEDMKGGDYFFEQIERAIQLHDRLLLVLSENSIQSKWVEREIRKTRKIERAEKRRKLFPITLTDYAALKKWACLDSDTGEDLAEEVRKYHIPDFSNWKNHDAFEAAFARLEKDLRSSVGK